MNEETDNTIVEEEANDSVSSTEEQDLEYKSQEELIELYRKEKEAKQKAIAHMREQEKKRKETPEPEEKQEEDDEDESVSIREEVRRAVQEQQKESLIAQYSEGSRDWLKQQEWAKSLFQGDESEELYVRFSEELKDLTRKEPITSPEKYRELMALAHVNVTKRPDALLQQSAETEIAQDKSQGAVYRGSVTSSTGSYGMTPQDKALMDHVNRKRQQRGEKPLSPKDFLKK